MKQTLKETAKMKALEICPIEGESTRIFIMGAQFGAEWQKKQSPWTSVKMEKPPKNKVVLVNRNGNHFAGYLSYAMSDYWWDTTVLSGMESHLMGDDDLWMPIPEFNE